MSTLVVGALSLLLTDSFASGLRSFQPPQGALIAGFRETETHRLTPPPIPSGRHHGMPQEVSLWLHIDPQGNVLGVYGIDEPESDVAECRKAAEGLRYIPFERNGVPVEAWVQDTLYLKAAEDAPSLPVLFPRIADPSMVTIQLSRSGCYGSCPSYSVTIQGDGSVVYRGKSFVSIPGTHRARISTSDFAALLERFRAANFLALKDRYRAGVTDNPTYCLSLNLGGKRKVVEDYVGGWVGMPAVVTQLEDAVDRAADSARWVSSSPGTIAAMQEAGIAIASPQATRILRAAVDEGDFSTARTLLAGGTPISSDQPASKDDSTFSVMYRGFSLPELAAYSDRSATRLEMLNTLLSFSAVRADQAGMQRALARAVQSGHLELALALIAAGADPSVRFTGEYRDTEQNETYLTLAASSGVWAMIDDALARPHDIHAVDSQGHTALVSMVWGAPQKEDIFPVIDRLLAAGADHSELDRVLLDTCHANWIPGLVARGGNINARNAHGDTPLFQSCSDDAVQAMLDAGADPSLRNIEGKTAVQATYPPEHGKEDSRAAIIRRFIAAHASPKAH